MSKTLFALLLGVLVLVGAPVAQADIPELAGAWHLDANDAASPDTSGHNLTANRVGAPVAVSPARFGNGLRFPTENDYLDAGSHSELQPAHVTVMAWVRSAATPATVKGIVSQGAAGSCSFSSYSIYTGGSAVGDGGTRFYVHTAGGTVKTTAVNNASVWNGQWHLLTGTYDGTTSRIYIDGSLAGSGTGPAGPIAYSLGLNNDFIIGGVVDPSCVESTNFTGDMDEVRVYNRALSQEEIAYLARSDQTSPPELPIPSSTLPGVTPPPPPAAENLTPPEISSSTLDSKTQQQAYDCSQGTWSNLAADPRFTYTWWRQGGADAKGRRSAEGQTRMATTARYVPQKRDLGGTFFCEVSAQGADGNVVRATSQPRLLTGLPDSVTPPSATNQPRAYGNFRIRGIDVFQVVQPSNLSPSSGPFDPGWCGGGTPTPFAPVGDHCEAAGGNPTQATYQGVTLDASKRTFARVYVDMSDARTPFPAAKLRVTLTTPDLGAKGAATGKGAWQLTQNPPVTSTPYVTAAERANGAYSVQFELNPATLLPRDGRKLAPVSLDATVALDRSGAGSSTGKADSFVRDECLGTEAAQCAADDHFRLNQIPVAEMPNLDVALVPMETHRNAGLGSGLDGGVNASPAVIDRVRQLFPGGERWFVRSSRVLANIQQVETLTAADALCAIFPSDDAGVRTCRQAYVNGVLDDLIQRDGSLRSNGVVAGVHHYPVGPGGPPEPGFQLGPPVARNQKVPARLTINDGSLKRPLTAAAREFGHVFGLPNASPGCGGNGEDWPDDQTGRLQGLADDFGGVRVDGPTSPLFDLMSFCAPEATAWLSARNWNRSATLIQTLLGSRVKRLAAASRAGQAFVSGVVGPRGARVLWVNPADSANLPPAPDPGSRLRVRSLNAAGKELALVGAAIEGSGGAGTFAVAIPSGTVAVELVMNGQTVDRKARSRAPRVRVTAPRGGKHVGRGALRIAWTASDPDRDALTATVEFAPNGRSGWRPVFTGPSTGVAKLPGSLLERSSAGRLRVRVSDGFSVASARSGPLRTDGHPPTVELISPRLSVLRGGGRTLLEATAQDDRGDALTGRSVTWFAGKRRLGRGARLRATLPAGTVSLRVVARDRFGRTARVTRRLKVEPNRLVTTRLLAPAHVSPKTRTLSVTVAATLAATLRVGGRSYQVGPRAKTLKLALPKSPARGVLKLTLALTAHGPRQPVVREQLTVVRS